MEDSVKCSSHTFSGLLRILADTVVLELLVPFFSFFFSFFEGVHVNFASVPVWSTLL